MKNIFFVFAFLYSCSLVGQGNLQYNQTRFIKLSGTPASIGNGQFYFADSVTITVPVGKTLKIESASIGGLEQLVSPNLTYQSIGNGELLSLDGVPIAWTLQNVNQRLAPFPLWLPAGNYKLKFSNIPASATLKRTAFISAIEFNIVP